MGETWDINRDRYGKIECGVNEVGKRGECFEKKKVLISRHNVFGIPCSLWARRSGVGIAARARDLCLVRNIQFSCGTHLHLVPGFFARGNVTCT